MSVEKKFFLPEGYKENLVRSTMDIESGGTYWNKRRLASSRDYQYATYQYVIEHIRKNNLKSLIDVGCGPAMKLTYVHNAFPKLSITGVDQDHPISFCKDRHSFGKWLVDDFENPDPELSDLKADLVICSDVIEHVIDPDKLLDYIKKCINKNGNAILSTPDRDRLYGRDFMKSGHNDHVREWNAAEFKKYLQSRGWDVLDQVHLPGIRPSFTRAYFYNIYYHFIESRPTEFHYNQTLLVKPSKSA